MDITEITYRMDFLLPEGSDRRLEAEESEDGKIKITVDMHGLTTPQARRLLNNIIAAVRRPFEMEVIHGYHHGTAIRDMIYTDFQNPKIQSRTLQCWNPGTSILEVA